MTRRTMWGLLILVLLGGVTGLPASTSSAATSARPAVIATRVIGHSVKGRPIIAYRVGDRGARTVVAMSTMHGDERATRRILTSIRDGRRVHGIDLWLIPVANPDGLARDTRKNAHGVDLNRNYPYRWADLDGRYESGRAAGSEPETRALMRFFADVRPARVVSFHQPLHGVDVSSPESRTFARRLAAGLDLPRKNLTCGGTCHGTFTQWYMHRFPGVAVTVEYGAHPTLRRMTVSAPRQLLQVLGGTR
jgi:protein MpaA